MSTNIARRTIMAAIAVAAATAIVSADVKTRERTQFTFGGFMGGLLSRMAGQGGDGVTSTVAVRGSRKATMNDRTGEIIDLAEEKVYEIDVRRKEYRVTTFDEMRERFRKAQEDAEKQAREMPPEERHDFEEAGKEMEIDFDVKETGATRQIAGHTARQVIVTVTMREKGKTLEEGGGMVMTNDIWFGPELAALDQIREFDMKYARAIYGEALPSLRQMAMLLAMYPGVQKVMERGQAEAGKLSGTPLMTTMTVEAVKSAEQMTAEPAAGGGGGIGGALAGRLARRVAGPRQTEPRSTLVTSTHELLSVETSVADADVAIPAGFRERR